VTGVRRRAMVVLTNRREQHDPFHASGTRVAEAGQGEKKMLWTIFVILLVLWLLGLVTSYTLGGFIHILLVVAVVILIINLIQGRRVV
jgi:uncharacterized membrane protein YtjA (UPF0391 family)